MKLFRCTNEICPDRPDFESAEPVCPACKAGAGLVLEIARVHYLVPAEGPIPTGIGPRMVACSPKMARLPKHATGDRVSVSCPTCRATKIFIEDERDGVDNHVPVLEQRIASEHGLKGVAQG